MTTSFESVLKSRNLVHLDKARRTTQVSTAVRRVCFVLREHFSMMAFTGAVDALLTANLMSSGCLFEVLVVGGASDLVVSDLGIAVSTDCPLALLDERRQDILIVCGGFRVRLESDPLLRAKLRHADAAGAVLGGLWNGAYFLAEAGLLEGHECAFHPDGRAMMAELFPGVRVSNQPQVVDRRRISCAGPNSSLGLMREIVRCSGGTELLSAVDNVLSCDKTADVAEVGAPLVDVAPVLPRTLKLALELMGSNIEDPIGLEEIAFYVRISRRQLERLFRRHVGTSPERYYLELRLTHARQLLQHTRQPLVDVALASGFASLPHFHRCFRAFFDITPGRFRERSHLPGAGAAERDAILQRVRFHPGARTG